MQTENTATQIEFISPEEAFVKMNRGGVLLDVRTDGEFRAVHATGAVNLPLGGLQSNPSLLSTYNTSEAEVLFTCKSGKRAEVAARLAIGQGLSAISVVEGGTDAWVQADLSHVKGKGIISIERQVRIGTGVLVASGSVLGLLVSAWFFAIPILVGCGLIFAGITDWCGMGMGLMKMPWNR
ncbi:rhodanese-like domain-containing protein [Puniceicoccaceae bacterium K14]|nr:rhodanese-like domain-containing protein [Puniceicoccaceae bacterium K14]